MKKSLMENLIFVQCEVTFYYYSIEHKRCLIYIYLSRCLSPLYIQKRSFISSLKCWLYCPQTFYITLQRLQWGEKILVRDFPSNFNIYWVKASGFQNISLLWRITSMIFLQIQAASSKSGTKHMKSETLFKKILWK